MPELTGEIAQEQVGSPERTQYHEGYVGLQVRILMGNKALDPKEKVAGTPEEIKQQIDNPRNHDSTYHLLSLASTDERIKYWQKRGEEEKLSTFDQQKATWIKEMVASFHDEQNSEYLAVLKTLKLGDKNNRINLENLTAEEANKLYEYYFNTKDVKPIKLKDGETRYIASNVLHFIDDIAKTYTVETTDAQGQKRIALDYDGLKKALPAIQWLASVYGDQYSNEFIVQLIDAEAKNTIAEKKQELITKALEKKDDKVRIDDLEKREEELLTFLQNGSKYEEIELLASFEPAEPKKDTTTPSPDTSESKEYPDEEPSKPLPSGFKWRYEKAFDPLHDKPDKLRQFPEAHLVEEMVKPSAIAHKLKQRDMHLSSPKYAHITEEQLTAEITSENKILEGYLAKLGLNHSQLVETLNSAMGAYQQFVENKYKIKLPKIGDIAVLPIWGKTAEYYHPERQALAFVHPTTPAIFFDMEVIQQAAANMSPVPWYELKPQELNTLIVRLLNEIKPHETTHLSSDLAFWYLDKAVDKGEHQKVTIGKVGTAVSKPIGLDNEGDIVIKRRGRGIMEAITVELTNQWAKSLNQPLDIDAYQRERQVLHELEKVLMKDQGMSQDQAFDKFVQAYFTPDGFSHLAQELSGRHYEKGKDNQLHKTADIDRPHFLEVTYALMEYADHSNLPNYSLAISYIHDRLTEAQKQEVLGIVRAMEEAESKQQKTYLTLPKMTRDYLKEKLTGAASIITPSPEPKEPPKTTEKAVEIKEFPVDSVKLIGKEGDRLKIVLSADLMKKANEDLLQRSWSSRHFQEQGGFFIGKIYKTSKGEMWTEATDYIPAIYNTGTGGNTTFTTESWAHASNQLDTIIKDRNDENYRFVSYLHTHPQGFAGIMTDKDDFINQNFFGFNGAFAYVFGAGSDPNTAAELGNDLTDTHAFFSKGGVGNKIGKEYCKHVGVYYRTAETPSIIDPPKPTKENSKEIESLDEIIEEVTKQIEANKTAALTMNQETLSTFFPSFLPAIQETVRKSAKNRFHLPISLNIAEAPTIIIGGQAAKGTMTINAGLALTPKKKIKLDFSLKPNAQNHISFMDMTIDPPEIAGINVADAILEQADQFTINQLLQTVLQQRLDKQKKNMVLEDIVLQFDDNNKLQIEVKGKKKS